MLGVMPECARPGLGARLKLAQREAALDMGLDLIEWTFDPLQARNAHFNFAKLGVVVEEYEENIYGESSEPAASRHADRSLRRGVEARDAARRAPHRGGRACRQSATARWPPRQSSTRRCQGSRGCGQGRRI